MIVSRRELVKVGTAATLSGTLISHMGEAQAQTDFSHPLRFGVIADPQFAPVPNIYGVKTRHYSNSLWKLAEAIAQLNNEDLDFVITLGDLIDRYWESFQYILPLYENLRHEKFFLLGNHDFNVPEEYLCSVRRTVGLPSPYYEFSRKAYRFIVLDGNEVSLFGPPSGDPKRALAEKRLSELRASGALNAQAWNGSLSDDQFAWLQAKLIEAEAAQQRVIIFNHYPVFPAHELNLWDSERVVRLVRNTPNVVAYFNGHNHAGNYGELGGKHFLTFRGMVETATDNAFAVVEALPDKLNIRGFGLQESKALKLT